MTTIKLKPDQYQTVMRGIIGLVDTTFQEIEQIHPTQDDYDNAIVQGAWELRSTLVERLENLIWDVEQSRVPEDQMDIFELLDQPE